MSTPTPATPQTWLVEPQPQPNATLRLFCFPYAGGGAAAFVPWRRLLPPTVALHVVQLPGRESRLREPAYRRMTPLVDALAPVLAPLLDRPYAFFGHSMGALVAFESARALRRRGAPLPVSLMVSGRRAPQLPDRASPLHPLDDAAFVQAMIQRYNGIPRLILDEPELMEIFLPILRADVELFESYVADDEAPLATPIVAFGGESDPHATLDELRAWQEQSSAGFRLRSFPGDHFYLQPQREALVTEILRTLALDQGVTP